VCENAAGSYLERFIVARIEYFVSPALRGKWLMKRFIEGEDRSQSTLLPECLEDYVADDNPVRVIEVFVNELDLGELGFDGPPRVSSSDAAQDLPLWLFEPTAIQPSPGARDPAQP
jgi:hypothetical protein